MMRLAHSLAGMNEKIGIIMSYEMLQKYKKIFIINILLLVYLLCPSHCNTVQMDITVDNLIINQPANYGFNIWRSFNPVSGLFNSLGSIPINSIIVVSFPPQFLTLASTTTLPCTNTDTNAQLICSVDTVKHQITITGYYASTSTLTNSKVKFQINSIINPYPVGTYALTAKIVDPNGNTLDSVSTAACPQITYEPGSFKSCSISANSAYVDNYATFNFKIQPTNFITSDGALVITLPSAWQTVTTVQSITACSAISNLGAIQCSLSTGTSSNTITITKLTTGTITSAFQLSISKILVPSTVNPDVVVQIASMSTSLNVNIDQCTVSTIADITAAPFQSISLVSNDNVVVQSSFTATLTLQLSRLFSRTDLIVFQLPTQFSSVIVSSVNFNTMTATFNLDYLTLSNFPSNPDTIPSNNAIIFNLSNIKNPISTSPIYLKVSFYRGQKLYQQQMVSYTAIAGIVTSYQITADSQFIQNTGPATIGVSTSLSIPANSIVTIIYPSSIIAGHISSSLLSSCALNGFTVSACSYVVSQNQINMFSIFLTTTTGTISLGLPTFINPPTIQPTTYSLYISDSNNFIIMTGSYLFKAKTKTLIANTVSASSYTVLDTGVTYTISITTNFAFSSVSIIIPTDISIGSNYASTCAPNSFSSCSLSGSNMTFIGTSSAGSYDISWGYTTNPNSFQTTGSFQITTYYKGWAAETSQGIISIKMNKQAAFKGFSLLPSSYANNDVITVTVALTLPINSPPGQLTITFPTQIAITTASCTNCRVISPYIYLTLAAGVTASNIIVSNVKNVGSYKPVSSFTVSLRNSNNFASLTSTTLGWTNNVPSSFTTLVSGDNNYRGESNNFKFQLSSLSGAQSTVQIGIDSSFGIISQAPVGFSLINSHTLSYPCSGSSCTFNFSLTNPTTISSYTFSLTSLTSDSFQVSTSISNSWTFDCATTQCRRCLSNSSCIDCYSSSISSYYILNSFSSQCVLDCPIGYFKIGTVCSKCDSNCSQCVTTSTTCLKCPTNYFLDTTYKICVPSCQNGYFSNSLSLTCDLCTGPCLTCNGTTNKCLSCVASNYLFANTCSTTCISGYYIANTVSRICDPCDSNCLTCTNTTKICLTCNNAVNLYFQNNKCVSICSSNYFLVNSICTYCQNPCKVCYNTINTCSSCFINSTYPIYYNHYCITAAQCPIGHYIDYTNSSCQICPASCTQCTSPTVCSVCASNFYLFGTLCIGTCPNTTFISSNLNTGLCQTCNNCSTCSSSSICTSCSLSQYLYVGICYSVCPAGTFSLGTICTGCSINCPTCQNYTYCTSCVTSMNLYQGSCNSNCPTKTYSNTTQQLCVDCPASCATCTSPTSCQTCVTQYSLQNSQCVLICSKGVSFNQICYPCGLHCSICQNTTCSLCDSPYFLYNNTCLIQCPSNMLSLDTITCVPCSTKYVNCSTCDTSVCLSCTYGQLDAGTCKPCSPGSYAESGTCTSCPSACSTCMNLTYCLSCSVNNYMLNNMCSGTCPRDMVPNGTTCSYCATSCSVCNLATSLCSVCNGGVYLHNNLCITVCPSPLITSYDFLTCVTQQVYFQQFSKAAKIIPFPFSIATAVIILIGALLKWFYKQMHLQTVLCGLLSFIQLGVWVIFLIFQFFYWQNYHTASQYNLMCAAVGLALLYLLNGIHLRFFYKYISQDMQFVKYTKKFSCTNLTMLIFSTSLTFKFYRFLHSKFLGRDELSMILSSPNRLYPFSLLTLLSLFFCTTPIFVGCALALYNSIDHDQQFFIALDTITVTGIMILLMLMDMYHPSDYFIQEHESINLKKKMYQEESQKLEMNSNPMDDNVSHDNLIEAAEDEGDMSLPPSANKFQSTFHPTELKNKDQQNKLEGSQTKIKGEQEVQGSIEQIEESQPQLPINTKTLWAPKEYDHNGYLIKYDANNNPVKYDQNGYRVEIDQNGVHHFYNEDGNEVKIINGEHVVYDSEGFILKNGKRYDGRGYEVRQQNGGKTYYDSHGYRVEGEGSNVTLVDQFGNIIKIDQNGNIRKYNSDGYEIVDHNGKQLLKDESGNFVRKNKLGEYQIYDPADGLLLKMNPVTGQLQKYDEFGFRVIFDKFGNMHRYDQDGFQVTVLPGGETVRYDEQGYRVQKDQKGNLHRYDADGYELIVDQQGNFKFIDKNGFRVEKDLYGQVRLYDQQGNFVVVDPETGVVRRYNEEGLQIVVDMYGHNILKDKRGRIVKNIDGETYEKFDEEGNKIWLDDEGYEVEEDGEGHVSRYDKIGERVQTQYDIEEEDEQHFESTLFGANAKKKTNKYRYKPQKEADQQAELNKLMEGSQFFTFDEEGSQISQLKEFHDYMEPIPERQINEELDKIVNKERSELVMEEGKGMNLDELRDLDVVKNSCYHHIAEPGQDDVQNMIGATNVQGQHGLADRQLNRQRDYDAQLNLNDPLARHTRLKKHPEFDEHGQLIDRDDNIQADYDQQAIVREIDEKEPNIYAIKKKGDAAEELARQRAIDRNLRRPKDQDKIEIKSVADVSVDQRSFDNEGVQPIQNKTDYDQIDSIDELEMPLARGRNKRGGRSEVSLSNNKKDTQTVYNYNTVQVQIKNQHSIYDQNEDIESLHEEEWQEQMNPTMFARRQRVKEQHSSNANTNILYVEDDSDNKDTLSEFVNRSASNSVHKPAVSRYQDTHQMLSGRVQSIEQIQQQLFNQVDERGVRERRQFKLSGAPNPLVEYAKTIEANKKSLQQKMYLDHTYKR